MDRKAISRIAYLLVLSVFAFILLSRTSGFDGIRPIQFLLMFASGMCVGVALSLFRFSRKA